jgi:hypothetical protein
MRVHILLLLFLVGACNYKKQKLSDFIKFDDVIFQNSIQCRDSSGNFSGGKFPINPEYVNALKDAERTHDAYKYARYCKLFFEDKATHHIDSLIIVDNKLIKYQKMHFLFSNTPSSF